MKKKSISELIHFFVRHPLQNSLQMKFWRWLVSTSSHCFYDINPLIFSAIIVVLYK